MKKFRIDAMAFIFIISALLIANLLNTDKPVISEVENRMLRQKPDFSLGEVFSGEYFRDYEDYYSDTFIKRDALVKASMDLRDAVKLWKDDAQLVVAREPAGGLPEEEPVIIVPPESETPGPTEGPSGTPEPEQSGSPEPTPTPTPTPTPREFTDDETVGYYLIIDGKAVQLFKFDREAIDYYTDVLNEYHEVLGDSVRIYSVIAPTAGEFARLRQYSDITDSQNDAMDYLHSRLDDGIVPVDVYAKLNEHKDEYIYFRTDHHWTALGAYYGYVAFTDAAGIEAVPLNKYAKKEVDGYLGSTYRKTLNKELEKNPDTIYLYLPFTEYEYTMHYTKTSSNTADIIDLSFAEGDRDKYLMFMSTGGATWSEIKTDNKNGRKILVMKDSFGNAWVPFLLPHYEEIYVVDARFYSKEVTGLSIPEFIEEHGISEMAFMFYMEDVNWTDFMEKVENHLK